MNFITWKPIITLRGCMYVCAQVIQENHYLCNRFGTKLVIKLKYDSHWQKVILC